MEAETTWIVLLCFVHLAERNQQHHVQQSFGWEVLVEGVPA